MGAHGYTNTNLLSCCYTESCFVGDDQLLPCALPDAPDDVPLPRGPVPNGMVIVIGGKVETILTVPLGADMAVEPGQVDGHDVVRPCDAHDPDRGGED